MEIFGGGIEGVITQEKVSTRRNKRGSHTTLQTDFIISNVRGLDFLILILSQS